MFEEMTGNESLAELRRHAAHAKAEMHERDGEWARATQIHEIARQAWNTRNQAVQKRLDLLHDALARTEDAEGHQVAAETAYAKAFAHAEAAKAEEKDAEIALNEARRRSAEARKRYEDVMAAYLYRIENPLDREGEGAPENFDPQADIDTGE